MGLLFDIPKSGWSLWPQIGIPCILRFKSKSKHVTPVQLLILRENKSLPISLDCAWSHWVFLLLLQGQHKKLLAHVLYALKQIQVNLMIDHLTEHSTLASVSY